MDGSSELKSSIQNMRADEFEAFVASVWSSRGWTTEITQSGRDEGIDIIATKSGIYDQKGVIQAKCYSDDNKVGRPDIQQYSTLEEQVPDADTVIVVTSSSFTSDATALAEQLNVKTVDGGELTQAALTNLPEQQLELLLNQRDSYNSVEQDSNRQLSKPFIPTDDLTQSEQDLEEIYRGYYKRYTEDAKGQSEKDRRLIFQLESDGKFEMIDYIVRGRTHYIRISPEPTELLKKVAVTAEKYGWEILNIEVEQVNRAGFTIHRVQNNSAFSIVLNTGTVTDVADPGRQAKITSLFFSSLFNQGLSDTEVKEATGVYTRSSPITEIE
jgi:hypothetical protein